MKQMKIVWICGFSNKEIRDRLKIKINPLEPIFSRIVHYISSPASDTGVWITNGINEMKTQGCVELHIITPVRNLKGNRQEFEIEGVQYHFIRDENSSLMKKAIRYLFTRNSSRFIKNRKMICAIVQEINPDLVHVIGAENPFYSLALLDIPKSIPTILQLQALLVSLEGKVAGDLSKNFAYKGELEKELIQRTDYIGTTAQSFIEYIRENIKPEAIIVNTTLAMAQEIDLSQNPKEYTFVHYASSLSTTKATDVAIKAFILAHMAHPEISLDLIGNYSVEFKRELDTLIDQSEVKEAVKFEGRLPTHGDVLKQIRKSKFALLPIKTDIVPNTLHEAMANGLPLITTATEGGTILLNKKRDSILISPIGDVNDIAENMIYLVEHPEKAEELRRNAALTEAEHSNNHDIINHWIEIYKAIIEHSESGTEIPGEYLL